MSTVDSPMGTSASESMRCSHFWFLSGHPTHGCKTYRIGWCVPLSRSPAATGKWRLSPVLHVLYEFGSWCNTNPWICFFSISYRVQDLQESEGHVQETVENSLLYWRNSHLLHLKQIHHHFLVQLDQPLEDSGLKRRPPVSWRKYVKHFVKERWKFKFYREINTSCAS